MSPPSVAASTARPYKEHGQWTSVIPLSEAGSPSDETRLLRMLVEATAPCTTVVGSLWYSSPAATAAAVAAEPGMANEELVALSFLLLFCMAGLRSSRAAPDSCNDYLLTSNRTLLHASLLLAQSLSRPSRSSLAPSRTPRYSPPRWDAAPLAAGRPAGRSRSRSRAAPLACFARVFTPLDSADARRRASAAALARRDAAPAPGRAGCALPAASARRRVEFARTRARTAARAPPDWPSGTASSRPAPARPDPERVLRPPPPSPGALPPALPIALSRRDDLDPLTFCCAVGPAQAHACLLPLTLAPAFDAAALRGAWYSAVLRRSDGLG